MTEPKYALCPHCGYQNMKPDGSCGLCIPPEFRAETARALLPGNLVECRRVAASMSSPPDAAMWAVELSVVVADALIAALRKPPVKG